MLPTSPRTAFVKSRIACGPLVRLQRLHIAAQYAAMERPGRGWGPTCSDVCMKWIANCDLGLAIGCIAYEVAVWFRACPAARLGYDGGRLKIDQPDTV
jgi:hypothetical protein